RSLAVAPRWRGAGLGAALVAAAEAEARRLGVRRLYLLTTTASAFFARLGYQRTARDDAPPPLCATEQFTSRCPSSSHLMVKRLPAERGRPEFPALDAPALRSLGSAATSYSVKP